MNYNKHLQTLIKLSCLTALLFVVCLTSCVPVEKKPTVTTNPIANAKDIGRALGCMFGGCDPDAQDRGFQKDFEQIDRDKKSSR